MGPAFLVKIIKGDKGYITERSNKTQSYILKELLKTLCD